jgi:hypothetical protein
MRKAGDEGYGTHNGRTCNEALQLALHRFVQTTPGPNDGDYARKNAELVQRISVEHQPCRHGRPAKGCHH